MEDNNETINSIEETPYSILETNQSFKTKEKDLAINQSINKMEIHKINKSLSIDNNIISNNNSIETKYEEQILIQRENRKIMSEIKAVISKRENNNINMTKLLIKNILNNYKKDISLLYDDKNNTLLHIYVKKNDINSLEIILLVYTNELKLSEKFYNFLFLKNIENKTVFDIAIENNYISIIKLLYAQIEKSNNIKQNKKCINFLKNNIFHKCAEYDQCYLVIYFYEKIKSIYKYFTIDQISNNNIKDQMNPLHIASNKGNKNVLKLFLDLGGDINSQDSNGYTPLHYVVMNRNEKLAKKLILRGANKFIKDRNNRTPYDLALSLNDKKLVKLLFHKNFFSRVLCGNEIEPLKKTKNHCFLLTTTFFNIILKFIIIFRFIFIFYNINFVIFSFNRKLSLNKIYNNYEINYSSNNTELFYLNLNNYLNCIDDSCNVEVIVLFCSLITDFFLLMVIVIFKCCNNIFIKSNTEKQVESLTNLYEKHDKICVKCRLAINSSTKHCLICNRCVNNWDHHCYWLNSCINDKNYRKFIIFLYSILLFLFGELLFYTNSLYLFFNTKKLFFEKILNIENKTFLLCILKTLFFIIIIYSVILYLYSLIFILIPILKNYCNVSNDDFEDEIKKDLNINKDNDIINSSNIVD